MSSSVNLGVSMSTSIPVQKHPEFKNHLLCGRQFPSTFITSDEKTGSAMASSCTALGWRQCRCETRAEQKGKQEWSGCRTQPELCGIWDAGTNICNKTPLSVSTYPELQGAKDGHRCMDVSVVVSAAASRVATYKAKETSGTPWCGPQACLKKT